MVKTDKIIHVLQVGKEDWSSFPKPAHMVVRHLKTSEISDFVTQEKAYRLLFKQQQELLATLNEKGEELPKEKRLKKPIKYAALLLTDKDYQDRDNLVSLGEFFDVFEIFYAIGSQYHSPTLQDFIHRKMAQPLDFQQPEVCLKNLGRSLFSGQYGAKIPISNLQVVPQFNGEIMFQGQSHLVLTGEFGSDFQQIAYFRYNLIYDHHKGLDLFFENLCSKNVKTKLSVQLIPSGSLSDIVQTWEFDLSNHKEQLYIASDVSGYLAVSLFAKGSGELKLGPCHYRDSRRGLGEFILGGVRYVDKQQQEFMYYFDPQDFKPPLCVYFSGFRTAEGFEGYWMMKNMKTPFMLICDPRLEGGAFYLGSSEFEQKISDVIKEKLDFLGFDSNQLILSGLSMGTYGAIYHGSKLSPHAIIVGKPVLSLGEVALKEKLIRPGGFPTSLDILRRYAGYLNQESGTALDDYFWSQFKKGDFSKTTFIVAYMKNDDYDSTAFQKILYETRKTSATVIGRGWAGRHLDGGNGPTLWFLKQYHKVLETSFGRRMS